MQIQYRHQLPLLLQHFNLPKRAIEIGVAQGAFSQELLENGVEFIYCIDSWKSLTQEGDGSYPQDWHDDNFDIAFERLSKFQNRVEILRGKSQDIYSSIPDNSIGLLYLDGDHSYVGVKSDIDLYYSKLVKGGILASHDYPNYEGLKEAIEEFADFKGLKVNLIPETDPTNSSCWVQI